MAKPMNTVQLMWGIALVAAGVAVFFRVPVVIQQLQAQQSLQSGAIFFKMCFYLLAILLIGGGGRKIYQQLKGRGNGAG